MIIPTAGRGNIGDEALLESLLQNIPEQDVLVLVEESDAFPAELFSRYNAQVRVLPGLFTGGLRAHRTAFGRLLSHLKRTSVLYLVGADVMDGGYNAREAVLRFSALRAGETLGIKAVLTGFSWNGRPPTVVTQAAGLLRTSVMLARDPLSRERFNSLGPVKAIQSADLVFALQPEPRLWGGEEWANTQRANGRRIALVNASGLLLSSKSLLSEYVVVVEWLLRNRYSVVLVPHVARSGDSDLRALADLHARLPSAEFVHHIDEKMSASQVFALAKEASICFTARMHLAVIALSCGVPCVVLETQGKVRGLMQIVGTEFAAIPSTGAVSRRSIEAIVRFCSNEGLTRSNLASSITEVRALAQLNFRSHLSGAPDRMDDLGQIANQGD